MAAAAKPTKNQLRRAKKKAEKQQKDKVRLYWAAPLPETNDVQESTEDTPDATARDERTTGEPEAVQQPKIKTNSEKIKTEDDPHDGFPLTDPVIVDEGNHWCLMVVFPPIKSFGALDSTRRSRSAKTKSIDLLQKFLGEKCGRPDFARVHTAN